MTDDIPARILARQQVLSCRLCGLRSGCKRPVPFSGHNPNWIAVIGEAPGAREDEVGAPFVGPAGQYLRKAIDGYMGEGFAAELSYLNVVSCYPRRTPTLKEVEACRPNLQKQLETIRPSYALVVGGVAAKPLFPNTRMGELRGLWSKTTHEWGSVWYFFTWHPAAVLRAGASSELGRQFKSDLGAFFDYVISKRQPRDLVTKGGRKYTENVQVQEGLL